MIPKFDPGQCWDIQAFGLEACEECPFDYEGPPEICGGKAIKRALEEGVFPAQGLPKARKAIRDGD